MQEVNFKELSAITQNHPASAFEVRLDKKEKMFRGEYHIHTFHLEDHLIGGSRLFIPKQTKEIYRAAFYPLEHLIGGRSKGIGTLAHLGMYQALRVPEKETYTIVQDAMAEDLGHLAAMRLDVKNLMLGQTIRQDFAYPQYIKQIQSYAQSKGYLRPGEQLKINT